MKDEGGTLNKDDIQEFPWATAMMVIMFIIIVVIAGIYVIVDSSDDTLVFSTYLDGVARFSVGVGLLAIGRGIRSGLVKHRRGI